MSEAQPETVAGRATLKWFIDNHFWGDDELLLDILAIEAAARAALLSELRAAVEGLPAPSSFATDAAFVSRAAVLELLEPPR